MSDPAGDAARRAREQAERDYDKNADDAVLPAADPELSGEGDGRFPTEADD